jgi:hypothetical protein
MSLPIAYRLLAGGMKRGFTNCAIGECKKKRWGGRFAAPRMMRC